MAETLKKTWLGRIIRVPGTEFGTDETYAGKVINVRHAGGHAGFRFCLHFEDDGQGYWYDMSQVEGWWASQGSVNFEEEDDGSDSCCSEIESDEADSEQEDGGEDNGEDEGQESEEDAGDARPSKRGRPAGRRGRGRPPGRRGSGQRPARDDEEASEGSWTSDDLDDLPEQEDIYMELVTKRPWHRDFFWLLNIVVVTAYKYQQIANGEDAYYSQREFRAELARQMLDAAANMDADKGRSTVSTGRRRPTGVYAEAALHAPGISDRKVRCAACHANSNIMSICVKCNVHLHAQPACWAHWHSGRATRLER